jgi:hypothetical protein
MSMAAYLGGRLVDDHVGLRSGDYIEYMKAADEKGGVFDPLT